MIIDAHQHVWDLSSGGYRWIDPALTTINRTFGMEDLRASRQRAGVDRSILVQADDTDADTDAMLATASADPTVLGVVGWIPLDDPPSAAARLTTLCGNPLIVGIRALIHEYQDPDWILTDAVAAGLDLIAAADLPFDYVTSSPEGLRHIPTISSRHPELRIIIDHLGKPPIGGSFAAHKEWRALIYAAASNPKTTAKISGLYSALGSLDSWTVDLLRPFVQDALDMFGADRLMAGGDWPVCLTAGGYERTWAAYGELTSALSPTERAALFCNTAATAYGVQTNRR